MKIPCYSGPKSEAFWARVQALPKRQKDTLYAAGVLLQDIEERVLSWLEQVEKAQTFCYVIKFDDEYFLDITDGLVQTSVHQSNAGRFDKKQADDMLLYASKQPRMDRERTDKIRIVKLKGSK